MFYTIYEEMLICLIITLVLETLAAFILRVKDKKDYLNIVLVNFLTNPLLVSITIAVQIFYRKYYFTILVILEIIAVLVEGFIYKKYLKFKVLNPFFLSLVLNCSSYFIGQFINLFIY